MDDDYYKAIQSWFFQYNSWKMEKEQIILERGTITGIVNLIQTFTEKKMGLLLCLPSIRVLEMQLILRAEQHSIVG